jgi:hypothetical protein
MDNVKEGEGFTSAEIEESAEKFVKELEKISKDPETLKLAEDLEKKFGSVSVEDLLKPFTI